MNPRERKSDILERVELDVAAEVVAPAAGDVDGAEVFFVLRSDARTEEILPARGIVTSKPKGLPDEMHWPGCSTT